MHLRSLMVALWNVRLVGTYSVELKVSILIGE